MRVNQKDIANRASVSQATVSRVLAGDTRVDEEIRSRVHAAIEETNYRPDARARSLRTKTTGLIGLVVRRPAGGLSDDPFFSTLVGHIVDYLAPTEFHLCVDTVSNTARESTIYDELLRTRRVDGLILVESEAHDERLQLLHRDLFPFVLIGHPSEPELQNKVTNVDNDNVLAGEIATQHLIDNGFTNIGFLAGPAGVVVCEDRVKGFQKTLAAAGLTGRVWNCEFGLTQARDAAAEILVLPDRPKAFLVMDDFMALGLVRAARDLQLIIPRDIAMVSFNNSVLCETLNGGLTSVDLHLPEIVRIACDRLLALIRNDTVKGPHQVQIGCELKVRRSSQKLPSEVE